MAASLKQLQMKRDLLQNVVSQKPRLQRDLADVQAEIAGHETALPPLVAERAR